MMTNVAIEHFSIQELLDQEIILELQDGNHGERHPRQSDFVLEGIPFLTATNVINDQVLLHSAPRISYQKSQTLRIGWIQPNDVLLAHNATVGRVGIVPKFEGKAVIGTSLTYYRLDQKRLDSNFFALVLKSKDFQVQLERSMEQTTRNQVPITRQKELIVPLLPIEEQKRIASIAQKADRLRRTRRYAQQLSDGYLRSVFLEMFGDPGTNPKNWKTIQLGEEISFLTSGSRGYAKYYSQIGEIFLRVENVGRGQLLLNELVFVNPPDNAESRRISVKSNDLLISMTADLGRSAIIPENFPKAYINQHLGLIRLKELNPVFVSGYMSTPKGQEQFRMLDRGGVKSGLNFDDVRNYKIFVPPLSLQEKFAQIVQRFERLRTQQQEADRQTEHLFQTILHRAFRGEL